MELYSQGLSRWPRNFDLAYNKARLELEIATHPLLVRVLDVPVIGLLQQSLASHEYALSIDPDNADTLFNTAQVLTALAELSAKDESISETTALQYLEQALQSQQRCFEIQKVKYAESRQIHEHAASLVDSEDDEGGAQLDSKISSAYEEREEGEQWVSVVEPVTAETLIDTLLAQLSTLTALCSIVSFSPSVSSEQPSPVSLEFIEGYTEKSIEQLVSLQAQHGNSRSLEIALTKAILGANVLELAYRSNSINQATYADQLEKSFSNSELDMTSSSESSIAFSKALIAFNSAMADLRSPAEANARWNALSKAQKLLTTAANLPATKLDSSVLAMTHLLRGDISLLLQALSYPPTTFDQAVSNSAQLLKNGEVFYRNASKLFASSDEVDDKETANFRGAVVRVLQNSMASSSSASDHKIDMKEAEAILRAASTNKGDKWRQEQLQDMAEDGLVEPALFGMK